MEKKYKYPRINFKIGNCSSEDPDCPASELLLQTPSCKGWQSGRYCSYPQVVLLQLPQTFMISQITLLAHQYKIPSRVEVDYLLPNEEEYKRLGYFSMGNNMESNFQVRELKNIPVTINTGTVRFTMQKNHINKYNVFNQVGIISICLYGVPLSSIPNTIQSKTDIKSYEKIQKGEKAEKTEKNSLKIIQQLEMQKKQAIDEQDYETAGKIKAKIQNIKRTHAQLDDLQQRKQLAVQREDYDTARTILEEIKRIEEGFNRQDSKQRQPARQVRQQVREYRQPVSVKNQPEEEEEYEPMPQKKPEPRKNTAVNQIASKKVLNVDDIPISVKNTNPYESAQGQPEDEEREENAPKKLENLKGQQLSISEPHFGVIDKQIFMKIFSKHHPFREEGIEDVRQILGNPGGRNKNNLAKAVFLIVKVLLDDKITNILSQTEDLFYYVLERLKPKTNDSNIDAILNKVSDFQGHTNEKVREDSWTLMKELPNFQITNKDVCIRALSHVEGKKSPKVLAGRLEALRKIVQDFGAGDYLEDCAVFAVKNIEDKSNEVRNASIELIKSLVNEVGYQRVSSYLKNLRPAILKQIQDSAEREEMPSNREQIPISKKIQSKKVLEEDVPSQKGARKPTKSEQPPLDQCPYCLKRDPQFVNQDYRDIHLYNTCAMLMLCECQQAVEVSSLSSHLTSQCKTSKYYKKCPRCKEAVHQSKYKSHVESKQCNPAKPLAVANRCPLCHEDIAAGVGGWKEHLVDEGCPNHSR